MPEEKEKSYEDKQDSTDFDLELQRLLDKLKSMGIKRSQAARTIGYAPGTLRTTISKTKTARTPNDKESSKYIVPVLKRYIEVETKTREYFLKMKKGLDVSNVNLLGSAHLVNEDEIAFNAEENENRSDHAYFRAFTDFILDIVLEGDEAAIKEAKIKIEDKARIYVDEKSRHKPSRNTIYSARKQSAKKGNKKQPDPKNDSAESPPPQEPLP